MPLSKLQFRPGINQDITSYSNEGGWRDCDKIRFRFGYPEKLGGWEKLSSSTYLGSARALHNWIALDGSNYLGIGTHLKYYIEEGSAFNDITPIRSAAATIDANPFSTTNESTTVGVNDTGHGAFENDFVTFASASAVGGVVADTLNAEHRITRVVDADNYEITVSSAATSTVASGGGSSVTAEYQINTGLDTTVGGTGWGAGPYGGSNSSALQTTINEGAEFSNSDTTLTVTSGTGIASGDFILVGSELMKVTGVSTNDLTVVRAHAGEGADANVNNAAHGGSNDVLTEADGGTITVNTVTSNVATDASAHADGSTVILVTGNASSDNDYFGWGEAATGGLVTTNQIRLWSHDNFGEDLLLNPRDSNIYYWDRSNNLSTRAVELKELSGTKTSVPQIAKQILVSDQSRHVIAFGCDGLGAASNTVEGDGVQDPLLIRFSSQEDPIDWYPTETNTAGDLILGQGSTFMQALETKREILVWTDTALNSMRFTGEPFTFGLAQLASNITIMSPNAAVATEDVVFWMGIDTFYVYAGQTQQLPCTVKDKVFLDFNLEQADKVVGGVNSEFSEVFWFYPSASSSDNDKYVVYNYLEKLWYFGTLSRTAWLDRGVRTYPVAAGGSYIYNHEFGYDDDGSAMNSFIESGVIDIGDGDQFTYIRRVIPDLTFVGSTNLSSPQATFTVKARNFPGASFDSTASGDAIRTASSPVETFTNQLHLRARGRSFALRVESDALGAKWKLGSPRVDLRPDGRR